MRMRTVGATARRGRARTDEVRRARRATAVLFTVHGSVTGSVAARVPWIAAHVGVGVGQLGVALLMPGIGALIAMPISGRLAHDHGLRALLTVTILAWCACLILPALPTSLAVLCGMLLVYGAAGGLADAAMNAHGVLVEKLMGRSVMSGLHGCWSLGVLAGSALSALAARAGVGAGPQFAVVAAVLMCVGAVAARAVIDDESPGADVGGSGEPAAGEPSSGAPAPPRFALPTRPVLLIGLVGLCAVFAEQAGTDWSALFLRRDLGGSASVASLAVSDFAVMMAVVRLTGDRVIRALGPVATVRVSGACATAGACAVVLAPDLAVGFIGFALLGVGVALVVPLVFAAAGRVGPHPARSVAGVAGIAYGAGLVAPGLIGGIASATSLKASFCVVAGLVVVMALGARALRAADPASAAPGRPTRSGP